MMSPLLLLQWFLLSLLILSTCSTSTPFYFPRLSAVDPRFVQEFEEIYKSKITQSNSENVFFYDQILDHFSYTPESYKTFKQKYVIDTQYWVNASENAPIFAMLGAEGPIGNPPFYQTFFTESGAKFNALLLYMEHRFYGDSNPLANVAQQAANYTTIRGCFDSAQALADYAEIILQVKKDNHAERSPVIVFGGSYGGMLASWFRLKYPHIALGALASSAPVLYFDYITSEHAYFQVISDDFLNSSKTCYDTIKNSWNKIESVASQPNGLQTLRKQFNTCYPLNSSSDLSGPLWSMYVTAAQYNLPPTYPVDVICKAIDGTSGTDVLDKIAAGVFAYESGQKKTCYINQLSQPPLEWGWQTCTEMVFPYSIGNNTMFRPSASPFDLNSYSQDCYNKYGVLPRPHWGATYYGGRNISLELKRFGSNIIFTNGLKDPYSAASVLEDISPSIRAVKTDMGAHCADLGPSLQSDPQWLSKQRQTVTDIFQQWIDEYKNDTKTNNLHQEIGKVTLRTIV